MTDRSIRLIVAMDENNLIGKDNKIPWHLPQDLKFVKEVTTGHTIVMGRKNYESIGRPLPGRRNIVISRNPEYSAPGCEVFTSVEDVLKATEQDEAVYIFGGTEIYKLFIPYCEMMIVTRIHHTFEGDTYFPEIDWNLWDEINYRRGDTNAPYSYETFFYGRV